MDLPQQQDAGTSAGTPPFVVSRPARQTVPLIFASPHSGREYPSDLLARSRLDALTLRRSEDGFVDGLFADVPAHGAPLLAATFPRVYCDANREAWELDPGMFDEPLPAWVNTASPRVGAGLGTIARIVATGEPVYAQRLNFADATDRVRRLWQPYHDALGGLIAETRDTFGCCLLVDCHSMPSGLPGPMHADFILGDAHGTTCAPRATRLVEEILGGLDYRVRRNDPYAGGYVTRHYGQPREGIHALQIEVARALYMDERAIRPSEGMVELRRGIGVLLERLADADWAFLRP